MRSGREHTVVADAVESGWENLLRLMNGSDSLLGLGTRLTSGKEKLDPTERQELGSLLYGEESYRIEIVRLELEELDESAGTDLSEGLKIRMQFDKVLQELQSTAASLDTRTAGDRPAVSPVRRVSARDRSPLLLDSSPPLALAATQPEAILEELGIPADRAKSWG